MQDYNNTDTMRMKITGRSFPKKGMSSKNLSNLEKSRNRSQRRFESDFHELLESTYDAVILTDVDGNIIKGNERTSEYFQYDPKEIVKLNIINLISGADKRNIDVIYETLTNEQRVFIESQGQRRNKTIFPTEITVSLLHLTEIQVPCFFIRNISLRVETEKALTKAQQELVEIAHNAGMAEIATGVLHDVGNLLNSINVSCDLMLESLNSSLIDSLDKVNEQVAKQSDITKYLTEDPKGKQIPQVYQKLGGELMNEKNLLISEAKNLQDKIKIVKDVITTQQMYAKVGLHEEEISVWDLIQDSLAIFKSTIDSNTLKLDETIKELPKIRIQKSKLVHVFLNLIKNAWDALIGINDRPKRIYIFGEVENDEYLSLYIQDNGCGIKEENMRKIFTHGFTTKDSGHGFGLHNCANLMTEINGKIYVQSEGENQGATFKLIIPIVEK